MKTYQEIINEHKDDFNDETDLIYFLDNYTNEQGDDVRDQEDNISEYTDSSVPIYYWEITEKWQQATDCHGLAHEQGLDEGTDGDAYKLMTADLYCYYEQQLREDYNKLIELMDEEEDTEQGEEIASQKENLGIETPENYPNLKETTPEA